MQVNGAAEAGPTPGSTAATGATGHGGSQATCHASEAAWRRQTIDVAGTARTYWLSRPAAREGSRPKALIFAWHGLDWQGDSLHAALGLEPLTGDDAIIVYPDALRRASPLGGSAQVYAWDLAPDGADVAFHDAMRATLLTSECVDASRVFFVGRSWGGYFAHRLACSRPPRAVATVVAAHQPPSCATAVPAWMSANAGDPTVRIEWSTATRDDYLARNACSSNSTPTGEHSCVSYEGCSAPTVWCPTSDASHNPVAWSSAELWGFLAQFRGTP